MNIQTLTSEVQRLQIAVDLWNNIGLLFLFFTALIAAGYFVASQIATNKAAQLRTAQVALTNAQEAQLKRDLKEKDVEIAKLNKEVKPRRLNANILLEQLKGKPKANVEIIYKKDDEEAYMLADQIKIFLGKGTNNNGAGWEIINFRELSETDIIDFWKQGHGTVPLPIICGGTIGGGVGINFVVKEIPPSDENFFNTPVMTLQFALTAAIAKCGCTGICPDPSLPNNFIRIVVGSKTAAMYAP